MKNDSVLLDPKALYLLILHFRFSSLFYSTQLVDIFSYELPQTSPVLQATNKGASTLSVYNFHVLGTQNRFFIFSQANSTALDGTYLLRTTNSLSSITELFSAANWLERECAELHGVSFSGKKDLRNLMLQYGDSSSPFQKSFPTIGLKEMYYNPIKDTIIQNPVTLQI